MKNLKSDLLTSLLSEYALSIEEMIYVRGGDGDPESIPTPPPIKI